jgi:Uma2 family endonuclease
MSTRTAPGPGSRPRIPPLENGDRLTRGEFERRYNAMPKHVKAELIEGVVYMASPARFESHSHADGRFATWLGVYQSATPGTDFGPNATVRLALESEPQPDSVLFIRPEFGGQVRFSDDDYIEGAPELVVEIAASSVSLDLGPKRRAYAAAGIREYIVWRTLDDAIDWFTLRDGAFVPLDPDADGVIKSQMFAGLWLDVAAALRRETAGILTALQRGLSSPEHARFVADLQSRRTS